MTFDLEHALSRIAACRLAKRPLALLFDYDGTLVPIVPHPNLAILPDETRDVLQRLAHQSDVALGFLSGRKLDELKALVRIPDAYYAGTGGLEVDLRGSVRTPPDAAPGRLLVQSLLKALQAIVASYPGAWVEDKELGLAVHYRAVAAHLIPSLREEITSRLQIGAQDTSHKRLRILAGPMAMEINADLGWNKGTAVQMIVANVGRDAFPLYAGDAANDVDAMQAALALDGLAVQVGAEPSPFATALCLESPAKLVEILARLLHDLENGPYLAGDITFA